MHLWRKPRNRIDLHDASALSLSDHTKPLAHESSQTRSSSSTLRSHGRNQWSDAPPLGAIRRFGLIRFGARQDSVKRKSVEPDGSVAGTKHLAEPPLPSPIDFLHYSMFQLFGHDKYGGSIVTRLGVQTAHIVAESSLPSAQSAAYSMDSNIDDDDDIWEWIPVG